MPIQRTFSRVRNVFFAGLLAAGTTHGIDLQQAQTPTGPQDLKNSGFQEFSDRVQKYLQVHKRAEGTLPKLKSTNDPEIIVAHQRALGRKIKAARVQAKRGNIFTPRAAEEFKKALSTEFQSPQGAHAQETMKQGAPLKEVHLRVNQIYPPAVPYTSVPPTLLQNIPKLPEEIAYRVVSHDFVLLDVKANLVLDLIPGVIPTQTSSGE